MKKHLIFKKKMFLQIADYQTQIPRQCRFRGKNVGKLKKLSQFCKPNF